MSFRAHHQALLATFQRALTPAERYRARVLGDGGTLFSMAAVQAAYDKIAQWALPWETSHWTSPLFGTKVDANGQILVRYCLFDNDATPVGAGGSWQVVAGAGSKAPQHYTGKVGMQIGGGLPWASLNLTAHVIFNPASWQADAYPYFPLVESSLSPGQYAAFLLGFQDGTALGGYADTGGNTLAELAGYPPLGTLGTAALRVDSSLALPARRRLFINDAEGQVDLTNGSPSLTTYDQQTIYLGVRGGAQQYNFNGNINDVFITSKVVPSFNYLNSQKSAY